MNSLWVSGYKQRHLWCHSETTPETPGMILNPPPSNIQILAFPGFWEDCSRLLELRYLLVRPARVLEYRFSVHPAIDAGVSCFVLRPEPDTRAPVIPETP